MCAGSRIRSVYSCVGESKVAKLEQNNMSFSLLLSYKWKMKIEKCLFSNSH